MNRIFFIALLFASACLVRAQEKLTIVHTSDTHSCIEPISPNDIKPEQADKGGYIRRATLLSDLRKKNPNLLLLDCGDFSQGSAYYNLFKGEVEIQLMNEMRYDACTIGNHEFDFGLDNMARIFRMAEFPIVCCNYDFSGTPCDGLTRSYIIKEREGKRIGIFGVCPQLEGLVAKSSYGETKFLDPFEATQRTVNKLRNEEHCDIVICLSHLGYTDDKFSDTKLIANTRGIDVVLGGHSHTYFEELQYLPNADGELVPLDHEGKNARFVGVLEMEN